MPIARIATLAALLLLLVNGTAAAAASYHDDLLGDLALVEQKLVALAEAVPDDRLGWRPSEGVRSFSEALMHAANAHYFFARQVGVDPPAGLDVAGLEAITGKKEVLAALEAAFDQAEKMVEATRDRPLEETVEVYGREYTIAGVLHGAVSHSHEHLGQLIAYARSMGIVPPWSQSQ